MSSKCFIFAIQSYSSDIFPRNDSAFPKNKLSLYSIAWANFSKLLIKPTKYHRFHYPILMLTLDLQKQKTNSSVIVTRMLLSILTDNFDYRSGLNNFFASFPSKNVKITVINSFLQKLSTLVTAKSNISKRIDFLLLTSVTFLGAITMCSAFTPLCGYDNSTIFLIADVCCPNTKSSGKHCLHKKTFEFLGRSEYQCPHCASLCQLRNLLFEDQTNSFFLLFGQGVYIFEESPKPLQDVIGDVYCPGVYCFNREKCESSDGYVTTPRSIFG